MPVHLNNTWRARVRCIATDYSLYCKSKYVSCFAKCRDIHCDLDSTSTACTRLQSGHKKLTIHLHLKSGQWKNRHSFFPIRLSCTVPPIFVISHTLPRCYFYPFSPSSACFPQCFLISYLTSAQEWCEVGYLGSRRSKWYLTTLVHSFPDPGVAPRITLPAVPLYASFV